MHTYDKFYYEPVEDPFKLPFPQYSTVDCTCLQCGAITRLLVPVECIDWKQVAETYRCVYASMGKNVQELFDEAGKVFEVPLNEWLETKHALLLLRLEELLLQYSAQGKK